MVAADDPFGARVDRTSRPRIDPTRPLRTVPRLGLGHPQRTTRTDGHVRDRKVDWDRRSDAARRRVDADDEREVGQTHPDTVRPDPDDRSSVGDGVLDRERDLRLDATGLFLETDDRVGPRVAMVATTRHDPDRPEADRDARRTVDRDPAGEPVAEGLRRARVVRSVRPDRRRRPAARAMLGTKIESPSMANPHALAHRSRVDPSAASTAAAVPSDQSGIAFGDRAGHLVEAGQPAMSRIRRPDL